MSLELMIFGIVIITCLIFNPLLEKFNVPSLLFFLFLGMFFGEDGIIGIAFNDYAFSEIVCSIALVFIMFYGGFNTNLKAARPVLKSSIILSALGTILTALLLAFIINFFLPLSFAKALLIASLIASTDAASVFNILKNQNLSLKYHTDSLLELESGSNDPIAYTLVIVALSLLTGEDVNIAGLLIKQIGLGLLLGYLSYKVLSYILNREYINTKENRSVLLFGFAFVCYALTSIVGGNAYLAIYLCGILIGNAKLKDKAYLAHFFNSLSDIAQVLIFFLLGLLVTPHELTDVFVFAIFIMIALTLVVRPLIVSLILSFFKTSLKQILVVSSAGLRGAASIVFSITVILSDVELEFNIFNLVFCITLLSIAIQGTFLPIIARISKMIDENSDIHKTFNDYSDDSDISFIKMRITKGHYWCNKKVKEILNFNDLLITMIIRDKKIVIPSGDTLICENDLLILAAHEFENRDNFKLVEWVIDQNHRFINKCISEIKLKENSLIVLIERGGESIIPSGQTRIKKGDTLILIDQKKL